MAVNSRSAHFPAAGSHNDREIRDLLIIGGGINGAGIARDAAGRGYSVTLCEAGDFGSGTSSASTKLIHGGLRYLEHYEFRLVRESLIEREILWAMAPHIIRPMRFVLPHHSGLRPAWLLRLGLFLYDHIGGRKRLAGTRTLNLTADEAGRPLKNEFRKGFEYSDCWVEDSRLVIANLQDAARLGADIRRSAAVSNARHEDGAWTVELAGDKGPETLRARLIINAAGPWVDDVLKSVFGQNEAHNVRLVRGSHIVIPRKFDHDRPYIFQNSDDRIVFAIPYEGEYTLIGTTDADHGESMHAPRISDEEIAYLCETASLYFAEPVTPDDVVWTYSGVRPLYDDGASKAQEATRDYVLRRDRIGGGDVIQVFGGKITTYRRLAESMMEEIGAIAGRKGRPWTRGARLPGGEFSISEIDRLIDTLCEPRPAFARKAIERLVRLYGTRAAMILGNAELPEQLGRDFGRGLSESELRYLIANEWVRSGEDVLFRRTRLGIGMTEEQIGAVDDAIAGILAE